MANRIFKNRQKMGSLPNTSYTFQSPLEILGFYTANYVVKIFNFLALLVIALFIVIIGFLIAKVLEFSVRWLVEKLKINDVLKNIGFGKWLEKTNVSLRVEEFLGILTFWVVWVLFWMPAFDILGWKQINEFLVRIINYLPNAIVSGVIVVVAFFLGDFLRKLSYVWFKGLELKGAKTASEFVFYVVLIFGVASALHQLNVAREIIGLIIGGIILALSISFGLAFGLGGQELAREIIDKVKGKLFE